MAQAAKPQLLWIFTFAEGETFADLNCHIKTVAIFSLWTSSHATATQLHPLLLKGSKKGVEESVISGKPGRNAKREGRVGGFWQLQCLPFPSLPLLCSSPSLSDHTGDNNKEEGVFHPPWHLPCHHCRKRLLE